MKQSKSINTSSKIILLAAIAGTVGFLNTGEPAEARPAAQENTLSIRGVLRNFRDTSVAQGHTDFGNNDTGSGGSYQGSSDGSADTDSNNGTDNSVTGEDSDDGGVSDSSGSDSDGDGDTDSSDSDAAAWAPHQRGIHSMGNIATALDTNNKPAYIGSGQVVDVEWLDPAGREIHTSIFDVSQGDTLGLFGSSDDAGIEDVRSFRQWYRDAPGKNLSSSFTMTMREHPSGNGWIFAEDADSNTGDTFNFYGNMPENSADKDHTLEVALQFQYLANANQYITIGGKDDIYVFVNGQLAIDLGGTDHGIQQTVLLDRLGLNNGDVMNLNIFMAERTDTSQDFLLEMSFDVWTGEIPTTMGLFD